MYCRKCGTEIPDDSAFCVKCGTPVEGATEQAQKTEPVTIKYEEKGVVDASPVKKKKTGLVIACLAVALVLAFACLYFFVLKGSNSGSVSESTTLAEEEDSKVEEEVSKVEEEVCKVEEEVSILEDKEKLAEVTASVLKIECYDITGEVYATGSGFVAFNSNLIVTNYHVIEDHPYAIKALSESGNTYTIDKIVVYNQEMDIAIMKTSGSTNLTPLTFAEKAVEKTDKVVAIGSPLGLMNTVSDGIVSGFTQIGNESVIQFTASISHGSSGGVLLNEAGKVLGVTFASFSEGQNLNVAIPIQYVDALYNQATPAKEVTVKEFFDAVEHIYPLTYILENSKDFMGKTVTFQAYVSSLWFYLPNEPTKGNSLFFLVENESDVLGWFDKVYYDNRDESRASISKQLSEIQKVDDHKAIEVWLKAYEITEKEYPKSFVTVSGTLTTLADAIPDVYANSSSGSKLTLINVKIS